MPDWLSLTGRFVHLLPLSIEHVPDLVSAATEDRATFTFSSAPRDEGDHGLLREQGNSPP